MLKFLIALVMLVMLFVGYGVWQNNRFVPQPDRVELKGSLDKGIGWLAEHRNEILSENSAVLWWMVQESAELTQSPALKELFAQYQEQYFSGRQNAWSHLFKAGADAPMYLWQLEHLPDYNVFILYGASCSPELANSEFVKSQLDSTFCDGKLTSPACVTHQMMGFRFMRNRGCGDAKEVEMHLSILRDRVSTQLTWDFRVVDVYLQRVLMLVDTGAISQVKPVWIRRIIDAQNDEGGWSGSQPLLPLWGGRGIAFTSRVIGLKSNKSNFHATAQGVMLMSLLLHSQTSH